MRKLFILVGLVLALIVGLSACGGGTKTVTQTVTQPVATSTVPPPAGIPGHPCDPKNYYMECAANAAGQFPTSPLAQLGPLTFSPQFGIDFSWSGPSSGFTARSLGAHFGIGYLSYSSKDWHYTTLRSYLSAGLGVGFIWETSQYRPLSGCSGGRSDAVNANALVRRYGLPNAPIFFATDFDTYGYSSSGVIGQYYRCARGYLGNRTGAYGGLHTMEIAAANGIPSNRRWQTLAWSYGRWTNACVRQYSIDQYWHGYRVDYNLAVCSDWGQANNSPPPPPPDPYHIYFKNNLHFGKVTASEYNAVKTWDKYKCRNPVRQTVCVTTKRDLLLLAGRVYFLAHNQLVTKTVRGHKVTVWAPRRHVSWNAPNKQQPYGSRFAGMTHRANGR